MPPDNTTLNSDVDSSSTSSSASDVKEQSTSSVDTKDVNQTQEAALDAVVEGVREKHAAKESSTEADETKDGVVLKQNKTAEATKVEGTKEEPANDTAVAEPEPGKAVPYERFKERNEAAKRLETEVSQYKPLAERMFQLDAYCTQHNISAEDRVSALELVALINSGDSAKALEKLTPVYNALLEGSGQRLPQDLQDKVDQGVLTNDAATDMAKLRREKTSLENNQRRMEESSRLTTQNQLQQSLDGWTQSRMTSDPDFKPKAKESDADGKFELTYQRFMHLWNTVPVKSIQEAVALAERAYTETNATVKRFQPAPKEIKVHTTSNGSSTTKATEKIDYTKPDWVKQVANQVKQRHAVA